MSVGMRTLAVFGTRHYPYRSLWIEDDEKSKTSNLLILPKKETWHESVVQEGQQIKKKELLAQKKAEEALTDAASDMDYAQAKAELANIVAQLRSIEKLRNLRK